MPDRDKVRRFLLILKRVIEQEGLFIVPRETTLETLRFLGWTKHNLEETVLGLSVLDYSTGPEEDRERPGEIWVFGFPVSPYELYIKLKFTSVAGGFIAKCLSFHIAKEPVRYPLREKLDLKGKGKKP